MRNAVTIILMMLAGTLIGVFFYFFGSEFRYLMSYEDILYTLLFALVMHGIVNVMRSLFLVVPSLFLLRLLIGNLRRYFILAGIILGVLSSFLLAVVLKVLDDENCDSICLDPGTYVPFLFPLMMSGVIQALIFSYRMNIEVDRNDNQ